MGLRLDDLTDASRPDAVLCGQLDFVPGAAAQVLQFEGALGGADEHVFPLLRVVDRILEHKTCAEKKKNNQEREVGGETVEVAQLRCSCGINAGTVAPHQRAV